MQGRLKNYALVICLQRLRFADGAKRNLLPLYDVWGHKRMLIVATQESGREEEGARGMR